MEPVDVAGLTTYGGIGSFGRATKKAHFRGYGDSALAIDFSSGQLVFVTGGSRPVGKAVVWAAYDGTNVYGGTNLTTHTTSPTAITGVVSPGAIISGWDYSSPLNMKEGSFGLFSRAVMNKVDIDAIIAAVVSDHGLS